MTPAMLSADYWIARQPNPDQRILSARKSKQKAFRPASPAFFPDLQSPEIRLGICCGRIRDFLPSHRKQTKDEEDPWSDENRFSGILVNEPVWILETSADGQWFRIRTCFGSGWVQRRFIADAAAAGNGWMRRIRRPFFSLSPPDGSPCCRSGRRPQKEPASYRMGTCLRLIPAPAGSKTIDGRFYLDNYVVRIPARDPMGFCPGTIS